MTKLLKLVHKSPLSFLKFTEAGKEHYNFTIILNNREQKWNPSTWIFMFTYVGARGY